MATLAPNWAKRTAIAWPMPELPPVTRTFLPFRPGMASVGETVGAAVDMGAFSLADGGCRRWSVGAPGRYTAPNTRFRVGRCWSRRSCRRPSPASVARPQLLQSLTTPPRPRLALLRALFAPVQRSLSTAPTVPHGDELSDRELAVLRLPPTRLSQ